MWSLKWFESWSLSERKKSEKVCESKEVWKCGLRVPRFLKQDWTGSVQDTNLLIRLRTGMKDELWPKQKQNSLLWRKDHPTAFITGVVPRCLPRCPWVFIFTSDTFKKTVQPSIELQMIHKQTGSCKSNSKDSSLIYKNKSTINSEPQAPTFGEKIHLGRPSQLHRQM